MSVRRSPRWTLGLAALAAIVLIFPGAAGADVPSYDFTTPVFGLATFPDGSLVVADAGSGLIELRKDTGSVVVELPGVSDVAPIGRGAMFAVTGFGDARLYRVARGTVSMVADLMAFEEENDPGGGEIDSNPFDVAALGGGRALVADAGANDLLVVNRMGNVDWVAAFPPELAPTAPVKELAGCPDAPEEFAFVCELPAEIPAESVPTSVAIGPDGAYYVGELKGFPALAGMSKIWRIEPGSRHVRCGVDPGCTVVADGFTAVVDLVTGGGAIRVVELDEAGWLPIELGTFTGGTVNACSLGSWSCSEEATGLPMPIAATLGKDGTVYVAIWSLVKGEARVIGL